MEGSIKGVFFIFSRSRVPAWTPDERKYRANGIIDKTNSLFYVGSNQFASGPLIAALWPGEQVKEGEENRWMNNS
jgi:hypothetical protein